MSKLEARVGVIKVLPNSSVVDIVGNELHGDKYLTNLFAVKKDVPLCSIFEYDAYQEVAEEHPGLPTSCPVSKRNYSIHNYLIDESDFPDSLPVMDNWRVDIAVRNQNKILCKNHIFLHIEYFNKG